MKTPYRTVKPPKRGVTRPAPKQPKRPARAPRRNPSSPSKPAR